MFVSFLSASFEAGGLSRRINEARTDATSEPDVTAFHRRIEDLYREQTMALTRIRLLAGGPAVNAAVTLHLADHA